MPENAGNPLSFWQELKRRKVVRVIIVYAAASFVILELISIIEEPFGLPDWTTRFVFVILSVGLIISIILSWIYDITPEGIEKTRPVHEIIEKVPEKPSTVNAWKIATIISVVVIAGLLLFHITGNRKRVNDLTDLEKSIAVLPLKNWSQNDEYSYLGDAIADEIIMQLMKIKEFRVLSHTSTLQYKDNPIPTPLIAKELGVNFILEGGIQRHNDNVSIRVQFIRAEHEDHIWGEEYDGKWKDIFSFQDEIAYQIANELKTVLSPLEINRIESKPTENMEAYNLYLQGRFRWRQGDKEKSLEYYKRALEIDPKYALAYSGMAATYISYAWHGMAPRKDVIPQAKEAAMKALKLDNTLGEAHAELAFARFIYDWDWSESEKEFQRAIELNPSYAYAHWGYSWLRTYIGRHEEAIQEARRAHELDPLDFDLWGHYARVHYYARDFDRAIEEYQQILELYPENTYIRGQMALALVHNGNHKEAIEECQKLESSKSRQYQIAYVYGVTGEKEKAMEILDYYLEKSKNEFVHYASIFFIYSALNNKDAAFEWLERTYDEQEAYIGLLQVEPMFDNLRSDPRFQDLIDRMNFPDN
jgi:TolB-like protein/Tfp pilus assembly protein PilF